MIDYGSVESLLKRGAMPLGKVTSGGYENNLYEEVIDYLFCNEETTEDFYKITNWFLHYGMDISKPSVPYDGDNILNPLWTFAFPSNDIVLRTLKLLLDNGLSADDAGECWRHAISDFVNIYGDLTTEYEYEIYYDYIRKLMLITSYPHVLNVDDFLKDEIWYLYNDYDVINFRNWEAFYFKIDTSYCEKHPEVYKSIVTIIEKSTEKAVWRFGVGLKPEDIK